MWVWKGGEVGVDVRWPLSPCPHLEHPSLLGSMTVNLCSREHRVIV